MRFKAIATAAFLGLAVSGASAQTSLTPIPTGNGSTNMAVNPARNELYVHNLESIAIIDLATRARVEVAPPSQDPFDLKSVLAVNPLTHKVYVGNYNLDVVREIDGITRVVTDIVAPATEAMAVNPATNEIYMVARYANTVTAMDGATRSTVSIPVGASPSAIAVDVIANKVYVANAGSANVTVIDGGTKATTNVAVPADPRAIAVDPVRGNVYVGSATTLTRINGSNLATQGVPVPSGAGQVAVNAATGKVFVAGGGQLRIFEGATLVELEVISTFTGPLALDVVANKAYVGDPSSMSVMVIDGATHAATTVSAPPVGIWGVASLVANPLTHRVYFSTVALGVHEIDTETRQAFHIPAAGAAAAQVLVNPVNFKSYVINAGSNDVTIFESMTPTNVPVGTNPVAAALNPATGKVYVANQGSHSVTVIDGTTNATTTVPAGVQPAAVAVNPLTNRIYATSQATPYTVTMIDGATLATTPIAVGPYRPRAIAVDPATNRIYVTSLDDSRLSVIDGATHAVTHVHVPFADAMALDSRRNRIYVSDDVGDRLWVVDGGSLSTLATSVADIRALAVDEGTNRVYALKATGVAVIDGTTLAVTDIPLSLANHLAIDSVSHNVYVATSSGLIALLGHGSVPASIPIDGLPQVVGVNPATGTVLVRRYDQTMTFLNPASSTFVMHAPQATLAGGPVTNLAAPTLSATVCCGYSPGDPAVLALKYRTGSRAGVFAAATGTGPFSATLSALAPGLNFVNLFAVDALHPSNDARPASAAVIGAPRTFPVVSIAPVVNTASPLPAASPGAAYSRAIRATGGTSALTYAVTSGALPTGLALAADGTLSGAPGQSGYFTFTVTASDGNGGTGSRLFALNVPATDAPRLANISTRGQVLAVDPMIGGFVIGGSASKTVLVRARGPSLAPFGIPNALADPRLQLVRSSDQATLATNDDWRDAANAADIAASGFAPPGDKEAAVLLSLAPGAYTGIVSGADASSGVGIVEVFEVGQPETPLANLSTRGTVLAGDSVLIGGIVVQGDGPQTVVVRARGPSLAAFGVANPLANPTLTVYQGQVVVASNDDWQAAANAAAIVSSGFAPSEPSESAVLVTLNPGAYTAVVRGVGDGTGVGIVEAFPIP